MVLFIAKIFPSIDILSVNGGPVYFQQLIGELYFTAQVLSIEMDLWLWSYGVRNYALPHHRTLSIYYWLISSADFGVLASSEDRSDLILTSSSSEANFKICLLCPIMNRPHIFFAKNLILIIILLERMHVVGFQIIFLFPRSFLLDYQVFFFFFLTFFSWYSYLFYSTTTIKTRDSLWKDDDDDHYY